MTTFKELQDYLSTIPDINCGGCGIAAYFLYRQLKKDGFQPKIAYWYDPFDRNYEHNSRVLDGDNDLEPSACTHAVVKCNGKYYDSYGEKTPGYPYAFEHIIDEKFLLDSIHNRHAWNYEFDREMYLPEIEKKTGMKLS